MNRQELANLNILINALKNCGEKEKRGERIRAKEQEILEDERSSKFYLQKGKERGEEKQIISLINKGNELVEDKESIMKETETFYTNLYHSNGINSNQAEENLEHLKKQNYRG